MVEHAKARMDSGGGAGATNGGGGDEDYEEMCREVAAGWQLVPTAEGKLEWQPKTAAAAAVAKAPLRLAATDLVDLGAGTGQFTGQAMDYAQRASGIVGADLKAVALEPVPWMREECLARGMEAPAGHATGIPLPDSSVHAVVCANSFEWFATAPGLFEISRVLQKRGFMCMLWTRHDVGGSSLMNDGVDGDGDGNEDEDEDEDEDGGRHRPVTMRLPDAETQGGQSANAHAASGSVPRVPRSVLRELDQLVRHESLHEYPELDPWSGHWTSIWEHFLGSYYGTTNTRQFHFEVDMSRSQLAATVLAEGSVAAHLAAMDAEARTDAERRVAEAVGADSSNDASSRYRVPFVCKAIWCQLLDKD